MICVDLNLKISFELSIHVFDGYLNYSSLYPNAVALNMFNFAAEM